MSTQRYTKAHVDKQLAKQAIQFQEYVIEVLRLTFDATGSCIHIVKKDKNECAICGNFISEN